MNTQPPLIDEPRTLDLLRRLVRTPSINPALCRADPRGLWAGEAEVAKLVADELAAAGCEVDWREPLPGRVSVVGRLRGRGDGRSLMLNGHLDTVDVDGMAEPFSGRLGGGRVFGRGAYDMKGGVAAVLAAVRTLAGRPEPLAGDVFVAAVADEETESLGMRDVLTTYRPDGAVVTEPTGLALCVAHKGFVWLEVTALGRAAHGSRPDLGVDANVRLGEVLAGVGRLAVELGQRPPHPLLGPPSIHAGRVWGGSGESTYAESATAVLERRTLPGEDASVAEAEVRAVLGEDAGRDDLDVRVLLERPAFEAAADSRLVGVVKDVLERGGREAGVVGEGPWMDAAFLAAAGVDTVVIGPAGSGAHAAEEWVDADSVVALAGVLAEAAENYCGRSAD
ncbi:MAG: M20/M25/M40 family metallo-hydrolase [Gemmatimonadota bacterium]